MTEEERIQKLLSCKECKFATCEQCEISYTDKKLIKEYISEKDKIIDLMSEQLTTPIHSKEWVKEYYERKAKEYLKER